MMPVRSRGFRLLRLILIGQLLDVSTKYLVSSETSFSSRPTTASNKQANFGVPRRQQNIRDAQNCALTTPHRVPPTTTSDALLTPQGSLISSSELYGNRNDPDIDIDDNADQQKQESTGIVSTENDSTIKRKQKSLVRNSALAIFSSALISAKTGILPGLPLEDGSGGFSTYTDDILLQDAGSTVLCAALAYIFVKTITTLAKEDIISSKDSRKIIHTCSAPLFMLLWPLYSSAGGARVFASIVAILNAVRLWVAGSGEGGDESELANAVSRSGDAMEALEGPFIYCLVLLGAILGFWRDSLVGVVSVSTMAAGDGMADILGRRFGKDNKWIFSPDKSIAGSMAFWISATLCSYGLAIWLSYTGTLSLPFESTELFLRICAISFVCAAIELLPTDDNWTVPTSAGILAFLFLQ